MTSRLDSMSPRSIIRIRAAMEVQSDLDFLDVDEELADGTSAIMRFSGLTSTKTLCVE